ncbi:MAG: hypothetical protein IKV72_01090, partial [Firmicutes bacterium]|nr:hypothetical protein [Bacillota bacterium]
YLMENPLDWKPFQEIFPNNPEWIDSVCELADFSVKKAKVFCTDSIFCEYNHLDFITGFQTDLIEMETSGFYRMAELLEKPSIALLVVSDNSITGQPLFGMSQEQLADFNHSCQVLIPQIIERIVLQQKCNKVE